MVTHLKLCLATAIYNFKWVTIHLVWLPEFRCSVLVSVEPWTRDIMAYLSILAPCLN